MIIHITLSVAQVKKSDNVAKINTAVRLNNKNSSLQAGFTLLELMIAISLGLIIVAAATMLFLTSQKSYVLQNGMSDLQDSANFGLNVIAKDIRLTNLNSTTAQITDETTYGGIVLTSSVNATKEPAVAATPTTPAIDEVVLSNFFKTISGDSAKESVLSRSDGMTAGTAPTWTGASNVETVDGTNLLSDQLTIQFVPQYIIDNKRTSATDDDDWVGGYDCEGQELRFAVEDQGDDKAFGRQMIVQRYFLRADTNSGNEPNQPLALACESGFYALTETGVSRIQGGAPSQVLDTDIFGKSSGQIIMKRVDHFRVLLGTQNGNGYRYRSIKEYMDIATGTRPRILSVQVAALVRSTQSVSGDAISNDQEFKILDQDVKIKEPAANAPKYVRDVVSQTIALRNTFGDR